MLKRDIIVVGASAGGVSALKDLVNGLPADFQGTVFIVLHIPAYSSTHLPAILSKSGPLKAVLARDGADIEKGHIYIAPNDHHLLLDMDDNKMMVKRGPKENRFRPSIDALFRSAAYVYGSRVIGVILSGVLDDGTSGLWTIKRLGGMTIIQDPADAEQSQMPENVLEYVETDHTIPAVEMGPLIAELAKEPAPNKARLPEKDLVLLKTEVLIATNDNAFEMGIMEMGMFTPFTCPECHGALVRLKESNMVRFRCHTGHAYTASALLADITKSVEDMLWQSMRGMEELKMIMKNIGDHFEELHHPDAARLFRKKEEKARKQARIIHDTIFQLEQFSEDIRLK